MGICSFFGRRAAAAAKLILEDGRLEEFLSPVRVSQISKRNPSFFICNTDDLAFDGRVSAIDDDSELELDQLYFELPIVWLESPMKAEEMAALAVKARLDLKMANGRYRCCWFRLRNVDLEHFKSKRSVVSRPLVAIGGDGGGCSRGLCDKEEGRRWQRKEID